MNVRKPIDYGAMFAALDTLMELNLPQMGLYSEIGHLVSARPEKGAAVVAAEYMRATYSDVPVSLPGTSAGCGSFTVPMKTHRKCWPRP